MVALGFVVRSSKSYFAFAIVFVVPFVCLIAIKLNVIRMVMLTART